MLNNWGKLRIIIPLALLGMVLMRLVWLQIRTYPTVVDTRAVISLNALGDRLEMECPNDHPYPLDLAADNLAAAEFVRTSVGSAGLLGLYAIGCNLDKLFDKSLAKLNQWLFMAAVLMVTLMCRFATSSWTIALAASAVVLSRGRLLGELGYISESSLLSLGFASWMMGCAHFVRTGSYLSLGYILVSAFFAATLDRAFAGLFAVFPTLLVIGYFLRKKLAKPILKRLRKINKDLREATRRKRHAPIKNEGILSRTLSTARYMVGLEFPVADPSEYKVPSYERGGIFKTIHVPFSLWLYTEKRWLRLAIGWILLSLACISLIVAAYMWLVNPYWNEISAQVLAQLDGSLGGGFVSWRNSWVLSAIDPFDTHLSVSLLLIIICAFQSPADGLAGFWDLSWILLISLILVFFAAFTADFLDVMMIRSLGQLNIVDGLLSSVKPRAIIVWLEPVILGMGVCGVYNLMKVLDTRVK